MVSGIILIFSNFKFQQNGFYLKLTLLSLSKYIKRDKRLAIIDLFSTNGIIKILSK